MTKAPPRRQFKEDRIIAPKSTAAEIQCDYALGPVDTATRAANCKWGINLLPEPVSIKTAQKSVLSCSKLNAEIDFADTAELAGACKRGLPVIDAQETAAGDNPTVRRVAVVCSLMRIRRKRPAAIAHLREGTIERYSVTRATEWRPAVLRRPLDALVTLGG